MFGNPYRLSSQTGGLCDLNSALATKLTTVPGTKGVASFPSYYVGVVFTACVFFLLQECSSTLLLTLLSVCLTD